jgi:hypothetical protein
MERDGLTKRRQPGDHALHWRGLNHIDKLIQIGESDASELGQEADATEGTPTHAV